MTDEKQVPKAAFMARKGKERRRWRRVSAKIRVILKDSDTFVPLITRNIDPGGLFLQTDDPKARLELVNLRIDMGKGQPPLVVLGVVKHALNKARARELNRIPGMGIQFYGMSTGDQVRWNTVVQRMEARDAEDVEDEESRSGSRPQALPLESRPADGPAPADSEDLDDTEITFDLETPLVDDETLPEEGLAELLEGSQELLEYNRPLGRQRDEVMARSDRARDIDREDLSGMPEHRESPSGVAGAVSGRGSDDEPLLIDDEDEWPARPKGSGRLSGIVEEISEVILEEEQPLGSVSGLADLLEGDEEQALSWSGTSVPAVGRQGEYEIRLNDPEGLRSFIDRNVMQGTVFLETEDLVESGRTIHIHLLHPETEESFPLVGIVVSLNPGIGDTPRGMGVRFQGLTERHWEGLEKFVVYGFNVL